MTPVDHFSFVAPIYDVVIGGVMPSARLRALLDLPAEGWLLDAGGGTGRVSHALRDQVGGVALVDLAPGMLAQSRRKNGVAPARARVQRLPFPDGAFARIIVVDSLHHFGDQSGAARELMRVLAPGGRLVIEDFDLDRWPVKALALGEKLLLMRSRFLNAEGTARLFQAHGGRVTLHNDHPLNFWAVVEKANGG